MNNQNISFPVSSISPGNSNRIEINNINTEASAFDSFSFNTEEGVITFENREIMHLKEMLDDYIKNNHPEDLL